MFLLRWFWLFIIIILYFSIFFTKERKLCSLHFWTCVWEPLFLKWRLFHPFYTGKWEVVAGMEILKFTAFAVKHQWTHLILLDTHIYGVFFFKPNRHWTYFKCISKVRYLSGGSVLQSCCHPGGCWMPTKRPANAQSDFIFFPIDL